MEHGGDDDDELSTTPAMMVTRRHRARTGRLPRPELTTFLELWRTRLCREQRRRIYYGLIHLRIIPKKCIIFPFSSSSLHPQPIIHPQTLVISYLLPTSLSLSLFDKRL